VSTQSLRELKEVLQTARPPAQAASGAKTQHRYLLNAGGADGGISGAAEIEPTPVVCSFAIQFALDNLSSDVQQEIVRLLAQLLRQHRETLTEAGVAEEAPGE
jgi:hypothetical protein